VVYCAACVGDCVSNGETESCKKEEWGNSASARFRSAGWSEADRGGRRFAVACGTRDQLETDSLGGDPVLRSLKHDEVVRPASANRNTVQALKNRGLIIEGKGGEPLRIVWRLKEKTRK